LRHPLVFFVGIRLFVQIHIASSENVTDGAVDLGRLQLKLQVLERKSLFRLLVRQALRQFRRANGSCARASAGRGSQGNPVC
jgi:hypothetical protein